MIRGGAWLGVALACVIATAGVAHAQATAADRCGERAMHAAEAALADARARIEAPDTFHGNPEGYTPRILARAHDDHYALHEAWVALAPVLACQSPRWTVVAHERMAELSDALATHLQALVAMLALSDRHALGELELRVAEAMCRGEVHSLLAVQTARAAQLGSPEAHAAYDRLHLHRGSEIAGCVQRTREPHADGFTSEDYDPLP